MKTYYSTDKTTQIVISLLKDHGIRKVIVSPGTTNIALIGSMQIDPFFEMYSSVDERSAAYMACGMAYESGEPVVLSCTEATASRNYFPGLTEAYYRKLPILAITGTHGDLESGHLKPQVINRNVCPIDTVHLSVNLRKCKDRIDEWSTTVLVNKALLELTRNGGGPVHINLEYRGCAFNARKLTTARKISRFFGFKECPALPLGSIAIFVGSHKPWTDSETEAIDEFCSNHDAAVLCDKTSSYRGKYRIDYAIIAAQKSYRSVTNKIDLLIHIGEVSGDTYTQNALSPKEVWRINIDGEIRDTFHRLSCVFATSEEDFFKHYANIDKNTSKCYYNACVKDYNTIINNLPEINFSNVWIAQYLAPKIPDFSYLHLGIFNSLRAWNFAKTNVNVSTICNVGGFGIDGALSTLIGSSLVHPQKLHFIILGDLAFFYDMNSLGNRHIKNNIRILLINNGRGVEFRKLDHPCAIFGENADPYMAAAGHYGNQSEKLVKHYCQDLGFCYLSASSKEEFEKLYNQFLAPIEEVPRPLLFEVFTNTINECEAVDKYRNILKDGFMEVKNNVKQIVKQIIKK